MNRRDFVKTLTGTVAAASFSRYLFDPNDALAEEAYQLLDKKSFRNLADHALHTAKKLGATYADIRLGRYHHESIATREERVESVDDSKDFGFGVRILLNGAWGFASNSVIQESSISQMVKEAIQIAQADQRIQRNKIEIEIVSAYDDEWIMPMEKDPFEISLESKIQKLLAINSEAKKAGASFCRSSFQLIKEEKYFASSFGSYLYQKRIRINPSFTVTVVDKKMGRFETRSSDAGGRGAGYEWIEDYDFVSEVAKATEEAKMKHTAKSVEPSKKDLVIDSNNLALTIHETIGHPTELDRALGYEANFAGTSFVTPDKLGKLQYGSDFVTVVGDRTQKGGLSTVGYDDDGVRTEGQEFDIIKNGIFQNYQMAIGQAKIIHRKQSNGCAYASSWSMFPIQRMPNISLQPSEKEIKLQDLIDDVKDGIYIVGRGSWSIDQQRYNFQFGGQVFYEIKDGKIGSMLRDVAYQGRSTDFWNACDGICGKSEYRLAGVFNCGKGQPQQSAPVSHGAVPARFRNINVINTARKDLG